VEEVDGGGIYTYEEKVMDGNVTTNTSIPRYEHRTVASATSP
jgi:hypothetical protein